MSCSSLLSQQLGLFEEVTAGNFFGFGAKQMSMGGAGIAQGWDGASLYYNPAALARVYRVEFQLGLTHQLFNSKTSQTANRYDGFTSTQSSLEHDLANSRLGSINLTIPVPTYRGSLVIGFGINRAISFDRIWQLRVIDHNTLSEEVQTDQNEEESGGIYLYSAGAGIDLSPKISLGISLNVYSGDRELQYRYDYVDNTNNYSDGVNGHITEDYFGASLKAGLLVRPDDKLSLGFVIESPVDWQVEQTAFEQNYFSDDGITTTASSDNFAEYDLSRPFIFGVGAAYRINTFSLTGEIEYIDWDQMEYDDNPEMGRKSDSLRLFYREAINLRFGMEYQFPKIGLALRAGVFSTPLANDKSLVDDSDIVEIIDNDRFGFTLGAGWLMHRTVLFEGSYVYGSYQSHFTGYNTFYTERADTFQRLYVTISYRY